MSNQISTLEVIYLLKKEFSNNLSQSIFRSFKEHKGKTQLNGNTISNNRNRRFPFIPRNSY